MTTALDSLRGRIAVVTGGAGAIGTAITKALQEAGHRTVVLDRDADIACDLESEASTRAAAAAVLERCRCRGRSGLVFWPGRRGGRFE
jgi:nucleoside-diphosphate-sugar epimerase